MVDVAPDGHLQTAGKGLEDTLNLMMLVSALGLNVEIHLSRIAETLEEMEEHLSRHLTDFLAVECGIPHQPGPAAEVERHLTETIVHGQTEAITLDATLVAQSLEQALAKHDSRVFDGVVLVNIQVADCMHLEVDIAVMADLVEHVIKEMSDLQPMFLANSASLSRSPMT